jgi:ankyrin repeat protein
LHAAALNNHGEIVELLLKHKADIMKRNYEAKTCLNVTEEMGHAKLHDLLDYHMNREIMWRNRNCLLKIALNAKSTKSFKGIPLDIFREVIKYA